MLYKNKYGTWKYSSSMYGGMMNDNSDEEEVENKRMTLSGDVRMSNIDYKSAGDSRPRFALRDKILEVKSYHVELDEDDDGKVRRRLVRTQKDKDHYNKVVDALYSLGIYGARNEDDEDDDEDDEDA
jgi:hypothetical protein